MRVKAETEGRTKDVGLLDVTPENFIVPKGEENCYHCRIEVVKPEKDCLNHVSKYLGKNSLRHLVCII